MRAKCLTQNKYVPSASTRARPADKRFDASGHLTHVIVGDGSKSNRVLSLVDWPLPDTSRPCSQFGHPAISFGTP
jgi:hypothetical protein